MKGIIRKGFDYNELKDIRCIHLKNLFKAILEVNSNYFYLKNETACDDWQEQLERVFAYELYHQWSLIQKQYNDFCMAQGKKEELRYINGEVGKKLEGILKYPDLVLHGGQKDNTHQEIAVEIKRKANITPKNVIEDLEKLSDMITNGKLAYGANPFNWGVFILTCGQVNDIKNKLESYTGEKISDKVLCILCTGNDELEYFTINEIK